MGEINVAPLIVEFVRTFFASARDALARAQSAKASQAVFAEPTGLNIFDHRQPETQAALECIVFSFLAVEAYINYLFFTENRLVHSNEYIDWLKQKWRRGGLSVYDRFVLLEQFALARKGDLRILCSLFREFISTRNLIVHAYPSEYQALVEEESDCDYAFIHDVESLPNSGTFAVSGLTREIGRICLDDASRTFEIMLLMLSVLDEWFVTEFALSWLPKSTTGRESRAPRQILESLVPRHYPNAVVFQKPAHATVPEPTQAATS